MHSFVTSASVGLTTHTAGSVEAMVVDIGESGGWAYELGTLTWMYGARSTVVQTVSCLPCTGSQYTPLMPIS